jgi:lipoyl-dependent peroxiredoxin
MNRKASAVWAGDLKSGKGTMAVDSGVLHNAAYSFGSRFESGTGTNPEELIAAAHAGCFSMALSSELAKAGMGPERVETRATVTLEMLPKGPTVTEVHLDVTAHVPGVDHEAFIKVAEAAKVNCPISRLLNAKITMDAKLGK